MQARLSPLKKSGPLLAVVTFLVLAFAVSDALGQKLKRINCYGCRDAQLVPCEDHAAAAEWCEKRQFFCSVCEKEHPCCRGRGLTPCRCVDHDFSELHADDDYEYYLGCKQSQHGLVTAMNMKSDPIYAITEHFVIVSTMKGVKFSPGDIAEMSEDFNELKKAFPWIFRNVHLPDAHAMVHLYALRLERIYEKYMEALGLTLEQDRGIPYPGDLITAYLVNSVKDKNAWQAQHNGAALITGSAGQFVLAQKDTGSGGKNRRFFGPNLSGDTNFYDGVIHLAGRCLVSRFFVKGGGKYPPGWLKVGFPHWLEWEILEQCSYYVINIEISGLGEEWISQGWPKKAGGMARRTDTMPFAVLSKKDFADLGFKEHLLSWSYLKFLIENQPGEKLYKYWNHLSSRMHPRDGLMDAYEWSELTLENRWRKSHFGSAADDEELTREERFLAEFDRSRTHPDLETRASAAYYLKFCNSIAAAERILQAFQEKELLVRTSALEALKAFTDEEAIQWVVAQGLTHPNDQVRRNTAVALGTFPRIAEISVPPLIKLLGDSKGTARAGAARALGELKPEEAYLPLLAMADDKDPEVRVEAALALCHYAKEDEALTSMLKLLRDPVWAVRLAAIRAMHNIKDKRVIPALIVQLAEESGRLREDLHELLVQQTRQDFQISPERWQWWWDTYGDAFEYATGEVKKTRVMPKYAIQYHEVETCSKKFIFLLDNSSSMKEELAVQKRGGQTYGKGDLTKPRIQVAKTEIVRILRTLDKNILFNIITFSADYEVWKKNVVPGTKGNTKAAEKYLWDITVPDKGATNIYDTLMAAFDMVDRGFAKKKYESVVDTMFLLSDGNPTAGVVTDVDMILRTVKERNRIHGIKIHTFAMGGGADTQFLRQLANESGGIYQVIRVR